MVTEEKIREMAVEAITALGQDATPEGVKKYITEKLGQTQGSSASQFTASASGDDSSASQKVILTSFGLNTSGIVAAVASVLSEAGCDILDLSQKIMQEFFTMIMVIDISNSSLNLRDLQDRLNILAEKQKIKIYLQHEDVFRYMHRI